MKILFVENRRRTKSWKWCADYLCSLGHKIYWIVENHYYSPNCGNVNVIPYPTKKEIQQYKNKGMPQSLHSFVSFTDRNLNYFGRKDADHYYYYYHKIHSIISSVRPDLVIGESTQFHELLTIGICRDLGVLFLQPTSSRYPAGRFSFYLYDTLEPFGDSHEKLSHEDALKIAEDIAKRNTKPTYMNTIPFSFRDYYANQKEKLVNIYSYIRGERFCTPSPWRKFFLESKLKENCKRLNKVARKKNWEAGIKDKFTIMYPMQLQPEANIEVWGYPYKNQTETIRSIADSLQEDEVLLVKPNPNAKYELTDELIDLISTRNNIFVVDLGTSMTAVFPKIDFVLTVTGTIAIESLLSNKPVVTLKQTMNNDQPNCIYIDQIKKYRQYVAMVKSSSFPKLSDGERADFINKLVRTSFYGDPYSETVDNDVLKAFLIVLNQI